MPRVDVSKRLNEIAKRSSVGLSSLKTMKAKGVDVENHEDIGNYIMGRAPRLRPHKWQKGWVDPIYPMSEKTPEKVAERIDSVDETKEIDLKDELKRLNSIMAQTSDANAVDVLAKKINAIKSTVASNEKLDGLVPIAKVETTVQAVLSILVKDLQSIYLERPPSLVGLDVHELTAALQETIDGSIDKIVNGLKVLKNDN